MNSYIKSYNFGYHSTDGQLKGNNTRDEYKPLCGAKNAPKILAMCPMNFVWNFLFKKHYSCRENDMEQ